MSEIPEDLQRYLDIDWSSEPQSRRERMVRAVLLRRQLKDVDRWPATALGKVEYLVGYDRDAYASDAREAWNIAKAATDRWVHENKRREIEEALREVDANAT
ncbi:MAG: hypothetical protein ACRENA_00775 [Vulcanimicrobiaceae bacterium]